MKKWIGLILSAAFLAGALAACGGTSPSGSGTSALSQSVPAAAESVSEPIQQPVTKIYTDTTGRQVEVPSKPERIITINMTAEVVALGIKPVGASDNWLSSLDNTQKEGIESVGAATSLNLEKILELEPDLIITFEKVTDGDTLESLSKIAPTVIGPFFGDSLENLRTIGDLIGRSAEAEAWISAYEAKVEETKKALKDVVPEGKSAMLLLLSSAKNMTIFPSSTWPTLYEVLGLTLPEAPELAELTVGQQLSLEKLTEYDPEYIFLTSNDPEQTKQYQQELTENAVWQQLTAATNGHVYTLGRRITTSDVLALEWALDEITRVVEETGNP